MTNLKTPNAAGQLATAGIQAVGEAPALVGPAVQAGRAGPAAQAVQTGPAAQAVQTGPAAQAVQTGPAAQAVQTGPAAPTGRRSPLPVLMCGTFMIVLDFFIVNVALPSIQARLHASAGATEWVVAGYGLTFAVFLITAGRLGDRYGRRRIFCLGMTLFVLASAACGMAPTAGVLVAARLAQGLGGALISPTVLAIIGVTYPGQARVRPITIYGTVMGLAAATGQLLGGLAIQLDPLGLGWRVVFLVNVPVGLVALAFSRRQIAESRADQAAALDLPGMALVTLALTALVLPLVEGPQLHWPAWTWASLAAVPVLLGLLAASQIRASRGSRAPLLDPALFRQWALVSGLGTQLAFWCGQASFFLVLALYLQLGLGLSPLQAGLEFTLMAGAYLAASLRAPALTLRFGRSMITAGAGTIAAGDVVLLTAVATLHGRGLGAAVWLAPGLVLAGVGMGLAITPLATTVLARVDQRRAGALAGAMSTMQQVGNAVGVAVTGVIFFGAVQRGYPRAFELSLAQLGCLLLAVAALSRLMPRRS
jgi:EmrB/QacA subfamily drug resistance transporter